MRFLCFAYDTNHPLPRQLDQLLNLHLLTAIYYTRFQNLDT
ncbi:hypothetical protein NOC27_3115 [Nitrosococcus oceani AFC27]|nr:hypothetical protein NOC27_3115 [Nitrosococcus oceani AFC27]